MDYFNLKFHNTTVKNEIFAGIAMFMAMSYILVVNPTVLSQAGMDYNGVFLATVCVSGFTTIVSAFYTKLPIALAPGLGITSMFFGLATGEKQIHWTCLLLATYVSGILISSFVKFGVYDKIMEIMDGDFRRMIMSGIGFALFLYGISTMGLIKKQNGLYVWGKMEAVPVIICVVSLGVIYLMKKLNIKGFVLIGMFVAYCLSICVNYYEVFQATGITVKDYLKEIFSMSYNFRDIRKVMFAFPDVIEIISNKDIFFAFINAVFVFTMGHFFDAIGTNTSAFDAINTGIDIRIKDTVSLKRAITVDGVGNIVSGVVGTSTVTTYGESLVGIVSGGKTGITALTTGCLFLLCFFFSPLFTSMSTYVAAPALIYVGLALTLRFREFDRSKKIFFVFGLCIIAYVGITFNIGNAVLFGLIIYTIMKMFFEKKKAVSYWWIMLIFATVHILLNYIV
ncbi:MAG: NCS2 family permease [Lachnospiraceae bacterium]|nr:NCS2 family permease [Lachnospiraceae bacterium]